MQLFDTHVHLMDEDFDEDRDSLIAGLAERDVALAMEIACDIRTAEGSLALVQRYPFLYAAVGMHPHEAGETTQAHMDQLREMLQRDKVLALGEIGLDYHYDFSPREVQKKWFDTQLSVAEEAQKPVVIHDREAHGDCMELLRAHKGRFPGGIIHCFSGSYEMAKVCLDLGFFIAFGGSLTFKNARNLTEVAAKLPLDALLIETDCPYLTPEPLRGRRNDPGNVKLVCEKLSAIKGISPEELAQITMDNGKRLLGIRD